nr:hypothetical protein [candidate division Zixibacteria bacterium]
MTHDRNAIDGTEPGHDAVAFFGAITASVSHELNNVISIIDQSAGLLDDLLVGAIQGRPITEEQLQRVSEKIARQTERGIKIIKRLNRFAHSADYPTTAFELNDLLENLTSLIDRLAKIKGAEIKIDFYNEPMEIKGNPFIVQQIVYLVVKRILAASGKNDAVQIQIGREDNMALIEIHGPEGFGGERGEIEHINMLVDDLRGNVQFEFEDNMTKIKILIPGLKD